MTARRQPSATSLSQFARSTTPDQNARSYDYCNSFWGIADGGVDVLFARMRGAARTVEELRNFWKERALIEEEFAKRLAKLSKTTVGRDEIGEFRNSIDSLRTETEKQSSFHLQLAQQIRNDLEAPATAFVQRQLQHRKTIQAQVEKQFKNKQAQEAHVNKAREKYEQDCLRINSFTAQSSLVQGKDLERITLKLEKAQQTVQANERDFANFARALQDTVAGWEQEWKNFCDTCQDLEDERMEFTKDNIWAYANAVSTVCVSDDESCERLRLALEQFEPEKDQESFVAHYGTGNQMPDPPQFVSYSQESSLPSINAKPTTHPASFTRNTQRVNRLPSAAPPPQDEEPAVNMVGVGAGNRASVAEPPLSRAQSRTGRAPEATQAPAHVNGAPVGSSQAPASSAGRPGSGSMVDPTTMLVVGSNAYPVDPSKNPQQQAPQHGHSSSRGANNVQGVGDESDPMYRAMAELRNTAVVGRSGTRKSGTMESGAGASASSPPRNLAVGHNPNRSRDYRNSAELVVGSHPAAPGSSRPTSPSGPTPPSAALMKPPTQPPAGVIDSVMGTYHQSFPNEIEQRRSRPNSRRNSFNMQSQIQAAGQQLERPVSREGHAGIGANGRSASPSLQQPPHGSQHRGVSPSPSRGTSPAVAGRGAQQQQGVGIMLDPNGNVSMDAMADAYQQRQPSNFQPQVPPPPPPIQPQQQVPPPQQYSLQQPQQQVARRPSISNTGYQQQQGSYVQSPSRSYGFQPPAQAQQQQPVYAQQPQQQQQPQQYGATSPHPYAAAQPGGYNAPPPQQQPQQQYAQQQQNGVARANTMNRGAYYGGHQGYGSQPAPAQVGYGGYGGTGRSPSPQPLALQQPAVHQPAQTVPPTRQYTEDGRGVLFYVKALYDYNATIPEEFDFQQGDIIAVTATPEDGWWSGELLDEARRVPGRHIFPSNFVHLF